MKNKDLTFKRLREQNVKRCETHIHPIKDWSHLEWSACLSGEVGELQNLLKKYKKGIKKDRNGDLIDKLAFSKEIGDILAYLDLLAESLDISLEEAVVEKFNEVSDRYNCKIKL